LKAELLLSPPAFSLVVGAPQFIDHKNHPDFRKSSPAAPKILSAMKYPG
jgi:hypothetical protein